MNSIQILRDLVAFPTVSRDSNLELIHYLGALFADRKLQYELIHDPSAPKANLLVTTGPSDRRGVLLSAHSDVVPVDGQNWTVPPFQLSEREGRLFGRGTADMKGFVACAVRAMLAAAEMRLATPLQFALSYDEEVGCVGVRSLVDKVAQAPNPPLICIIGEPTAMEVVVGHKGKISARATCIGREIHSAQAPLTVNAIHMACDLISAMRIEQDRLATDGNRDPAYDVPYSTIHVGRINAGTALNIVPHLCRLDFEIRATRGESAERILERLRLAAEDISAKSQLLAPEAAIEIEILTAYPGLDTAPDSVAVQFIQALAQRTTTSKVAFGTEGGLYSERLRVPTVICGPGSMAQGHRPDEFTTVDQIKLCDAMLDRLLQALVTPDGLPSTLAIGTPRISG